MLSLSSQRWRSRSSAAARVALVTVAFGLALTHAEPPPSIESQRPPATPAAVEALIVENRLSEARDWLRSVDESQSDVDWTRILAMLASRYQQQNNAGATAEYYARAVVASTNPSATSIPADKKCLLRLAASSALLKIGRADAAFGAVVWNLQHDPDGPRVEAAAQLLLQIGSQSLVAGDHATATKCYEAAAARLTDADLAAAELGYAWSLAIAQNDPSTAADKLSSFALKYPDHADAPRAIQACMRCLSQSETDLKVNKKVSLWISERIVSGKTSGVTDRMYLAALLAPRSGDDENVWKKYALGLAESDATGQATSEALEELANQTENAAAEHFATMIISPEKASLVTSAAREAACRWAGRTQRWSILAMAADHESLESNDPSRSMGVERLFAEGFMQVGRPADARLWWEHLVDVRGANDFPTLLRCAETSVAHADVHAAHDRIEKVSATAGNDPFRETLVKMLAADLAIRQLNFDLARSLLESVVRAPNDVGTLRPRAQWLIGETFYMQQRFAEAVEAYRTVEGLDPESTWVAASLVQAGKAFEQLGRTRDAAVCYSTLLSRHAESPLAQDARRRLAALEPTADTTIRR